MNVVTLEFLGCLLVVSAGFFFLPGCRSRRAALLLLNLGFLCTHLPNLASVAALAAFLLSGYGVALLLTIRPIRIVFWTYLALLLSVFVYLKQYDFLSVLLPSTVLGHAINVVGLSYMLFRQIHLLVDVVQGQIPRVPFLAYLNYQINLFAILAGPIQRYQDFAAYWDDPVPLLRDQHEIVLAFGRVLLGVVEVAVLGTVAHAFYERSYEFLEASGANTPGSAVWSQFAVLFYAYPLYLYFNFAGYCNVVIGGAALVGLRLPENFDKPLLSRNVIDFWTRWHRTLGLWVRDYIFTPLYKTVAWNAPKAAPSLAFLCYFVAFFLMGVWHGSTMNFVVFGLLQGIGVSAAKLWETVLVNLLGRQRFNEYLESMAVRVLAIVATIHYIGVSVLFFPGPLAKCMIPIQKLLSSIGT
jgi:D-alanyl-lipoteichoic acid acyltransferase DltB (MBOAT superfamily)